MKADRYAKDVFKKLASFSNGNGHSSSDSNEVIIYDDEYYLDRGAQPPRFQAYRQARWEKLDEWGKKTCEDVDKTITLDELDFALKRELRLSPEERYQFQKQGSYMRDLSSDDWDKGCHDEQCIPECPFYPEYGRIEDSAIIEEYNKHLEKLRNEDRIVEPPSESEMVRLLKELKHLS